MSYSKIAVLEEAVSSFDRPFTVSELCVRMAVRSPKTALTPRETTYLLPHIPGVHVVGKTGIVYAFKMRSIRLYARE